MKSVQAKLGTVEIQTWHDRFADGTPWMGVHGPITLMSATRAPVITGPDHTYLRPYGNLLDPRRASPDVGYVQYGVATLRGRDPRVLYAIAIRPTRGRLQAASIPADLQIYPGVALERRHRGRLHGDEGRVHHFSVREARHGGVQVYANVRSPGGIVRPGRSKRVQPREELGGLIHLGQTFAKDWNAFDPCGIAATQMPETVYEARRKAGRLQNYPQVENHPSTNLVAAQELLAFPNYLWQAFYLGQRPLTDHDVREVVAFWTTKVSPLVRGFDALDAYDGGVEGQLTTVPLDFDGDSTEPYRFLHTITTILPGRMAMRTAMVAMPDFLPILSADHEGREDLYAQYARERLRKPRRDPSRAFACLTGPFGAVP